MARAEDNPCLDGHPNPRPAGAGFRAFGSGPVPLRVCGHLESSGAGETAAQSFLANKPLAPVFSSLAFSPAVDCHPLQIRIDSGKESGKQTGVSLPLSAVFGSAWRFGGDAQGFTQCRLESLMTNKPQTRRATLDRPRGGICAYRGCSQDFQGLELPQDWRSIVMAPGSLLDKRTLLKADRDGLLCPGHVSEILRYLRPGDEICSWRECPIQGMDIRTAFNQGWRHLRKLCE